MKLKLGWLYYDLMNTYGDRGNVLVLKNRALARDIDLEVIQFSVASGYRELADCDLFMMGGAEDRQQEIVAADLKNDKKRALKEKVEGGTPGLFICGAYQFLGQYYQDAAGHQLECLGILPFHTVHPGTRAKRLIGDIVVGIENPTLLGSYPFLDAPPEAKLLIGFENHGGRTTIDDPDSAIGRTVRGFGNNSADGTEGYLYLNTLGTYLHGPALPRNPMLADFLLAKALSVKYNERVVLVPLNDDLENENRKYLLSQLYVKT